jgi:hypothetical protein
MPPVARDSGGPEGRPKTSWPWFDRPKPSPHEAGGRDSVSAVIV